MIDWAASARDFVVAAAGAGAGTWAAFQLERDRRARERRDTDVVAGNLALVLLAQMINRMLDLQRHVNETRDHEMRWASKAALVERDPALRFDIASLAFLLSGARRNVVSEIELFQRHFRYAEMAAVQRARLRETLLEPSMREVEEAYTGLQGPEDVYHILPSIVRGSMRSITDEMIRAVDEAVAAGADLYDKLREALQDAYPIATFVMLEFPGSPVPSESTVSQRE